MISRQFHYFYVEVFRSQIFVILFFTNSLNGRLKTYSFSHFHFGDIQILRRGGFQIRKISFEYPFSAKFRILKAKTENLL